MLSNGEQFRCDLARALAQDRLVVFDEYTSVVDRTVARIASAAIAKGIRSGGIGSRFVAVTCHYDVAEWLEPDWVLDMAGGRLARGHLRRPEIRIAIKRCEIGAWELFKRHHYLNAGLHHSAQCTMGLWNEVPVCFCAMIPDFGRANKWRVSRLVTLPDYQGIGIGGRFLDAMGDLYLEAGKRFSITASHPAIIRHCTQSPRWKTVRVMKTGGQARHYRSSAGRAVVSFAYRSR